MFRVRERLKIEIKIMQFFCYSENNQKTLEWEDNFETQVQT